MISDKIVAQQLFGRSHLKRSYRIAACGKKIKVTRFFEHYAKCIECYKAIRGYV